MSEPRSGAMLIGDIVLLNGASASSRKNRLLQWAVAKRRSRYSHVAFCLGFGHFIHADRDGGVEQIFTDDLFESYPGEWMAIRHKILSNIGREQYMSIYLKAVYYMDQLYLKEIEGFVDTTKIPHGQTFCSMLVNNILSEFGFGLELKERGAFPVDFETLKSLEPDLWMDVTDEHRFILDVIKKYPQVKQNVLRSMEFDRDMKDSIRDSANFCELTNEFLKITHAFDKMIGLTSEEFKDIPYKPVPFQYWDVPQPERGDLI